MSVYLSNMNDKMKDTNVTLSRISSSLSQLAVSNAGDLNKPATMQRLVKLGLGELAYPVGSQVTVPHSVYGDLVFDVVAHNYHKNPDDLSAPTMTLCTHEPLPEKTSDINFDMSELLWANTGETALPAGTYNFSLLYGGFSRWMMYTTDIDGTYQFTITKDIPAGGGFQHSAIGSSACTTKSKVTSGTITTYGKNGASLESAIVVTEGTSGTSLGTASGYQSKCTNTIGTFNSTGRNYSGSNNWGQSDVRQWLNSTDAANKWWSQRTPFDLPSSYLDKAGFLNGFGRSFLCAIGTVKNANDSNEVYEYDMARSTSYTTEDKMFLRNYSDPYDEMATEMHGLRYGPYFSSQMLSLYSVKYSEDYWGTSTGYANTDNDIQPMCVIY